ncbi:helix-turn-helix domain-containing protein [Lentzea sp. JNUCC 0626]|uniref:helix-turn-helix domain-containing protein n=1 Tax=Lentzea sp. JNUCC 0626 TaxID=3367513 RepID=UPI003749B9E3
MAPVEMPAFIHNIQCGRLLEALRGETTQREVAAACGWSQPTQVDLERGQKLFTADALDKLRAALGGEAQVWDEIAWHAELGSAQIPKSDLRWKFKSEPMRKLVDMERTATVIRCKASMLLPGMLQTPELMRYLMAVAGVAVDEIDRLVDLRVRRQEALLNQERRFEFIIDQAALARVSLISDATGVWAGQLTRLAEVVRLPNVHVRWVPFSHGFYPAQESDYHLVTYGADPALNLVYVERYDEQAVLPEPKIVKKYQGLWEEQEKVALESDQAANFLAFVGGPLPS